MTVATAESALFTVVKESGVVMATEPLDRETRDIYTFSVVARDATGMSSTCHVTVKVGVRGGEW